MKRIAAVAALGLLAVTVPALLSHDADADADGEAAGVTPAQPGSAETVEIGETADVDLDAAALADHEQILTFPQASYVKPHFSQLSLPEGAYVTVSDVDGDEVHRYYAASRPAWATSISGDTAVVKLHGADAENAQVHIDQAAYGLSSEEIEQQVEAQQQPESVCGEDDKRDAVCYQDSEPEMHANAAPVARLLIDGTTLCTGWRVGEHNRMLTNNHCFSDDRAAADTEVWFNYACVSCGGTETSPPVKVRGDQVLDTDETYDYTLFTVDDFDAISQFGHLTLAQRPAEESEQLYIPQHPNGEPSQIAAESDVDSGGSCQVDSATFDGYAADSDVSYYCDTVFGSSGSPVLSRETHEVVALHHFGGCPNSGVRADEIHDRVQAHLEDDTQSDDDAAADGLVTDLIADVGELRG